MVSPPRRRATRSAVSRGAATLVEAPLSPVRRRRRSTVTPTVNQPVAPKTPSPPRIVLPIRRAPHLKTPSRSTKSPSPPKSPNPPTAAADDSVNARQRTPGNGKGKQRAKSPNTRVSDEDFQPDPDSEPEIVRKKRSPNADKTYRPTNESLEHEISDHRLSPVRRPVHRRPSTSPRPRTPEPGNDARGTASQSRHENGQDEMDADIYDDDEIMSNDDKENEPLPQNEEPDDDEESEPEPRNEEPHTRFQEQQLEDDQEFDDRDEDDQTDLDQQEEHDSDEDAQAPTPPRLTRAPTPPRPTRAPTPPRPTQVQIPPRPTQAPTPADPIHHEHQANRAPLGRTLRPNFPLYNRDRLRRRAVFGNLQTHNPGYTHRQLRTILKRPFQDALSDNMGRTPKRARFEPTTTGGEPAPVNPADKIFESITNVPVSLTIAQISTCFTDLQDDSLRFATTFFNYVLTDEEIQAWPLHLLKREYHGLKDMAQFLTDAEGCTWRELFTTPNGRVALVHAIVGEYLKQHVFKATAFSFTGEILQQFQELDEEHLRHDAFVRNKKRAALLAEIIYETHGFWLAHRRYVIDASDDLARELMQLFEPLMQAPLFDPLVSPYISLEEPSSFSFSGSTISEASKADAKSLWDFMLHDLQMIVYKAVALHHSIRLSGQNGTNIRILHHMEKGSPYHGPETMDCINQADCERQQPVPLWEDDQLQVRMTCWGYVEAVVPHGIDIEQYQQMEAQFQERNGSQDSRSFEDMEAYFEEHLPFLPAELQPEPGQLDGRPREDGTFLDYHIFTEENRERRRAMSRPQDPKPVQQQRGSYVTFYRSIVSSHVFCSWGKRGHPPRGQSLDEAIEEARHAAGVLFRLSDTVIGGTNAALELADRGRDTAMDLVDRTGVWGENQWLTIAILGMPVAYWLGTVPWVSRGLDDVGYAIVAASDWTRDTAREALHSVGEWVQSNAPNAAAYTIPPLLRRGTSAASGSTSRSIYSVPPTDIVTASTRGSHARAT